MSDYFPPDILDEILQRLPSKSLCRFCSVSKSWYARITSQSFISLNLNRNINFERNTHFLLRVLNYGVSYADKIETYSFYPYGDTACSTPESLAIPSLTLSPPVQTHVRYHRILGHCNGLICITTELININKDVIVLWNPFIRKHMTLPKSETLLDYRHRFRLGFGVDSSNRDVKIVRIVYGDINLDSKYLAPLVEVYSLSTGAWRRIEGASVKHYLRSSLWTTQAYMNSRVHWANDPRYGDIDNLIVSFDMNDEVFREILAPKELAQNNTTAWMVSVRMDCLAVVGVDQTGHCFVWVMSDYGNTESWTKLCMVDVKSLYQLVGFRKNGDILMCRPHHQHTNQLVVFDPHNESVMELGIIGSGYSMYADKYVESLVLIDAPNEGICIERQLVIG